MYYNNNCAGYCGYGEDEEWSKEDKKALLEERKKILEAKLATIEYMIENLDKETEEKK